MQLLLQLAVVVLLLTLLPLPLLLLPPPPPLLLLRAHSWRDDISEEVTQQSGCGFEVLGTMWRLRPRLAEGPRDEVAETGAATVPRRETLCCYSTGACRRSWQTLTSKPGGLTKTR